MPLSDTELLTHLPSIDGGGCWWLGFSGGLDSTVLLRLLADLRQRQTLPELRAVHINHQLHEDAAAWERHCEAVCTELDITLQVYSVSVTIQGQGLEAAARAARYRIFEQCLAGGGSLLLAHHLDDQVETFFLRLMRGAGLRGLAGIPESRGLGEGHLYRPLLHTARAELERWARRHTLSWIEDGSNRDTRLDRNYLRRDILPLLEQRWHGYRDTVGRAVDSASEAEELLRQAYAPALAAARGDCSGTPTLALEALEDLNPGGAARLLRQWLQELGLSMPGRVKLLEFIQQLQSAGPESSPELRAGDYELHCYRGLIHALPGLLPLFPERQLWELGPGESLAVEGLGWLEMRPVAGGLPVPESGRWTLALRRGGERCRPRGRIHSQSLKKLLQEAGIPPWWRSRLPLVYDDGVLVAVADLWLCEPPGDDSPGPGWQLHWQRDSLA